MADRWQQMQDDIGVFTDKTFGDSTPQSKAHHLAEEAMEAASDPSDILEWADCTILLLDAVRKAGFTTEDLYAAMQRKMEINKSRKWGEKDDNGVVRHVK